MTTPPSADLVPVVQRLAPVHLLRGAIAGLIVIAALTGATPLSVAPAVLIAVSALYVVGLGSIEALWWRTMSGESRPGLIGLLLVIDGLYLAWAGAATGGASGIVGLLILLHVAGVTLLISHRTGVKIALWHALLLYGAHELHQIGVITSAGLGAEPYRWLVVYTAVLGLVAFATAQLSAVNERELRRRRADFEALAEFSAELVQTEGVPAVAQALADRLHSALGFPRVVVLSGDGRRLLAAAGVPHPAGRLPAAGPGSVIHRVCAHGRTELVGRLTDQDDGLSVLLPGACNLVVVPLKGEGGADSVLVAEHGSRRGGRIQQQVLSALERFADHGALALRAAQLVEALHQLATLDGLTGTVNRRAFDEALTAEVSRAIRSAEAHPDDPESGRVALLLLDVDNFKSVNDTYGHQVGDDVLRQLAATFMAASRDFDTVARYGGEEFAVILPGCDSAAAVATAERLRLLVQEAATTVPLTVSIGVSLVPEHADAPDVLVKTADDALLAAKAAGRNRVVLFPAAGSQILTP